MWKLMNSNHFHARIKLSQEKHLQLGKHDITKHAFQNSKIVLYDYPR